MLGIFELILLTKSYKKGKFCVAGIRTDTGEWVRLVSNDEESDGAISRELLRINGYECGVLDVVKVRLKRCMDDEIQPENYLIDELEPIVSYERKATLDEVLDLHAPEEVKPLLQNTYSYVGRDYLDQIDYSLALVLVEDLEVDRRIVDGRRKYYAQFKYLGEGYSDISVTDPDFRQQSEVKKYGNVFMVVSLAHEPYKGAYYKFAAKIFVD